MKALVAALERRYGKQRPRVTRPFEQVLWENIAYLANDERRAAAFALLKKTVGLKPDDILAASRAQLLKVTRHGIVPETKAKGLVDAAKLAKKLGSLDDLVRGPLPQARKALRGFPSIGAPGADRIALLSGAHAVFSLESNGLRVLARVLLGGELEPYDKTYRAVMEAVGPVPENIAWLTRAVLVLRKHGQVLCKRAAPACNECPLESRCAFAKRAAAD